VKEGFTNIPRDLTVMEEEIMARKPPPEERGSKIGRPTPSAGNALT
jgi:hypothetical protein